MNKAFLFLLCFLANSAFGAVMKGNPPPSFTLPTLESGQMVSSSQFHGKVVLIDLWASWCIPCRTSFPIYEKIYKKYHDQGFELIAINVDRNKEAANRFLTSFPVSFKVLYDQKGVVVDEFDPFTMPTSYLVDRHNVVVKIIQGFRKSEEEELVKVIESLL